MSSRRRLPLAASLMALPLAGPVLAGSAWAQLEEVEHKEAHSAQAAPLAPITRNTLIARAKRKLDLREVAQIATFAQPRMLDEETFPNLGELSGREAIRSICGSEQPGYWMLVRQRNSNPELDLDRPLGAGAYAMKWPACLVIRESDQPLTYRVQKGEAPLGVVQQISGIATPAEARQLLGLRPGEHLREGEVIELPFVAEPTTLNAKPGFDADLQAALLAVARVRPAEEPGAEIIVPVEGDVLASDEDLGCVAGPQQTYPFPARAVAAAYDITKGIWEEQDQARRLVHVVVTDNGFFGVPCESGNCPKIGPGGRLAYAEHFPPWFFDSTHYEPDVLGPVRAENRRPINYYNQPSWPVIDVVSGHGTHVAGLVLGGPGFTDYRSVFSTLTAPAQMKVGRRPWLQLVISNITAGKKEIPADAENWIFSDLTNLHGTKIVNLSFIMSHSQRPQVYDILRNNMRSERHANTLFVAAAGNRLGDLNNRRLYPAMLDDVPNLIVVAATDATGALAPFSNFGADYVDLAAPGCKLASWVDAERNPIPASGTSQAAPLVTFAAALLRSVSDQAPPALKARLIASGNLIAHRESRALLRYPVELSIPKALLLRHHLVTFRRDNLIRTVAGRFAKLQGLRCLNNVSLERKDVRSFKTAEPGGFVFYRDDPSARLRHCSATLAGTLPGGIPNTIGFTVEYEFVEGVPQARSENLTITAGEIIDVVYPN